MKMPRACRRSGGRPRSRSAASSRAAAGRREQAEDGDVRSVNEDPAGAGDVPGDVHAAVTRSGARASGSSQTRPSGAANAPGSPRVEPAGPSSARRKAALAATSAATHEPAATVTSRQHDLPGDLSAGRSGGAASRRRGPASCPPLVAMPPPRRTVPPAGSRTSISPRSRGHRRQRRSLAGEQCDGVVDRQLLTTPFRSSSDCGRAKEHPADKVTARHQRPGAEAPAGDRPGEELGKVAVIAGSLECGSERRVDEPVVAARDCQCACEHLCEQRRELLRRGRLG